MKSVNPLPATKRLVHSKYGCFLLDGERMYARRKEEEDKPAKTRRWVRETLVRFVKAREATGAVGRVRRVGRVRVLSVYDNPVSRPREIEPTNLRVDTVRVAIDGERLRAMGDSQGVVEVMCDRKILLLLFLLLAMWYRRIGR